MGSDTGIRVLITDDHPVVHKGLICLLEEFEDLTIVGEAWDGEDACKYCQDKCPDVILMDIAMPRMNGIEATRRVRTQCPNVQVIALTSFADDIQVEEILKAGAISYLMKNISGNELADAIRKAYLRQSTLAPEVAQLLIEKVVKPPEPDYALSKREQEILTLMAEGLSNTRIGHRLGIRRSTVKNHISNILSKLQVSSRTQAVAVALKDNLIP